jgi:hypothetical protein
MDSFNTYLPEEGDLMSIEEILILIENIENDKIIKYVKD